MTGNGQGEQRKLDAERQVWTHNYLRLADTLARRQFRRCGGTIPLDELVGEAQFALVYAASLYDGRKGVPFGAYVTMVIRHRLVQAVTVWRRGGRLDHVHFSDLATKSLTGESLNFDPPCDRTRAAEQEAAIHELLDRVRRRLPSRWFRVLELYYAYDHTLEEIGRQLGVSRERVRQLLAKAVARVRKHFPERITAR